jgi:ribosome maturation factor RimP
MEEERKVREVLESRLKEKGYTLEGVRYYLSKEGPKLELVVDRDDPISLDDIVALSDFISPILDENDPIAGAYTLDISSLGAEKPIALGKLANYDGRYVHLHLSHPVQGENILEGTLKVVDEETLGLTFFIKGRKKDVTFPKKDVDSARLAIKF